MKSNDLSGKTMVSKSRSMSILIKQKISIALGKTTQNRQKSTTKLNHCSYLGKERSSSLKSLGKTKNYTNKNDSRLVQKLSFIEQTPIKQKKSNLSSSRKQQSQKSRANESHRSSHNQSVREINSFPERLDQLLWIDSRNRKLKIVNKNVQTLGQQGTCEKYVEYYIADKLRDESLIRIQGQNFLLTSNYPHFYLAKLDLKSHKIQQLSFKSVQQTKLNFEGYLLLYSNLNQAKVNGDQIFIFLIEQIKKLNQDGLKEFAIISKIVKRLFEQKYSFQGQEYFILLLKIHKHLPSQKQKILDSQKLIAKKLQCIEKLTGSQNIKPITKLLFNSKKFLQ